VPTLGEDGGLDTELAAPLIDPMVLLFLVGGTSGEIPRNIDLDEVDAVLDCAALEEFGGGGSLPFLCADGSFTIPETLADGDYYWQVRGYGIDDVAGSLAEPSGSWSSVGHFIVGDEPAPAGPGGSDGAGGSGSSGGAPSSRGTTTVTADPTAADAEVPEAATDDASEESEEPAATPDDTGGSGAASEERGPESDSGDGGFPLGWILAGIGALVVLAGAGAFIRFLVVRR
jgi:hypothetical protein